MSRFGRDIDEIRLDIADAIGNGEDVIEHLRRSARARRESDGG